MANSELVEKYWNIPLKYLNHLKKIINGYTGNKKAIGYIRVKNLVETGRITYNNLKNISSIMRQLKDPNNAAGRYRYNVKLYNLNGGELFETWVNKTLEQARKSIFKAKEAKKKSGQSNAFIKQHSKNFDNPNPQIRTPQINKMKGKDVTNSTVRYESNIYNKSYMKNNISINRNIFKIILESNDGNNVSDDFSLEKLFQRLILSNDEKQRDTLSLVLHANFDEKKIRGYARYLFGSLLDYVGGDYSRFFGLGGGLDGALILKNKGITEIPIQIGDLRFLKHIDFEGNQLDYIPSSIGKLKRLEYLDLVNNKIEFLPERIGDCENLKHLILNGNKIKTLPDSIVNLENLSTLAASHNLIEMLPENIGSMHNLKHVYLTGNQITKLPESIKDSEIYFIYLGDNPMDPHYVKEFESECKITKLFLS